MLRNAPFASWAHVCALVSFVIAFSIFVGVLVRVLRLPRRESDRLASLPLSSDRPTPHEPRQQ